MNFGVKIEHQLIEALHNSGCHVRRANAFFDHLKVDCFLEHLNPEKDRLELTSVQITTWLAKASKFISWFNLMKSCMYTDYCLYIEIDSCSVKSVTEQIGKELFKTIQEEVWNSSEKFHVLRVYGDRILVLNFQLYYNSLKKSYRNLRRCTSFRDDFDQKFLGA